MKKDFLVEIGVEEIPALMLEAGIESFHNNLINKITSKNINFDSSCYYATPRRLVVYIKGLNEIQNDTIIEIKGPAKKVAFSDIGRPTQAVLGFIESNNAKIEDITFKMTPKGEYVFLNKTIKGNATKELLPEIIINSITNINFAKSMKWNNTNVKFVRPIRWILCLFGNEIINFEFANVKSNNKTYSIRRLGIVKEVTNANDYFNIIKELDVIIDINERCNLIESKLNSITNENKLTFYKDEQLIKEVANLTENPYPILCEFDEKFLKLPEKLLISTMVKKQRYFPLYELNGKLSNKFIVFSNGKPNLIDEVKYGNQKVLTARFSDAEFYYYEDLKTSLYSKYELTKNIIFQQKLGTIYQKTQRIAELAKKLYLSLILKVEPILEYKNQKLNNIDECAKLCKADLASFVVREFPELQGYAGMIYAQNEKISDEIAKVIYEHYKPAFKGDSLPSNIEGQLIAIADKLDTITGCFIINMIPKGSGDPYALRRAALGIIEIAINHKLSFNLENLVEYSIKLYPKELLENEKCDISKVKNEILDFIKNRFETKLKESNVRYDIINAIIWNKVTNIYEDYKKAMCLSNLQNQKQFLSLVIPFKRVMNITKDINLNIQVNPELFKTSFEKELYETFLNVKTEVENAINISNYELAFNTLCKLYEPIDKFFTNVLVMDKDETQKNNKIALLILIKNLFLNLADISKLLIEE